MSCPTVIESAVHADSRLSANATRRLNAEDRQELAGVCRRWMRRVPLDRRSAALRRRAPEVLSVWCCRAYEDRLLADSAC